MPNIVLSRTQTDAELEHNWNAIPWEEIKKYVERMQRRIYSAAENKDNERLLTLQKLTQKSFFVQLYAIRLVTIENEGKNTPGIDGKRYRTIRDKVDLLEELRHLKIAQYHPQPIRRVYIPKGYNSVDTRPLGIPTIFDRVVQMLFKLSLEPEWEARFHPHSYGFRPGRSCQDAIETIKRELSWGQETFVVDADFQGCFNNIPHALIVDHFTPRYKALILKWLQCGIHENGFITYPTKGTPQGGILSPLLANIALTPLDGQFNTNAMPIPSQNRHEGFVMVRYADDFVLITHSRVAQRQAYYNLVEITEKWHLPLNWSKTRMISSTDGFDFLGFHFQRFAHSSLRITPSKKSISKVKQTLRKVFSLNKSAPVDGLIYKVNQIIQGWSIYFRYCQSNNTFHNLDHLVWRWVWRWCYRRHPNKGKHWIVQKYFGRVQATSTKWRLTGDTWSLKVFYETQRRIYNWRVGLRSPMNPHYWLDWKVKPEANLMPLVGSNLLCSIRQARG